MDRRDFIKLVAITGVGAALPLGAGAAEIVNKLSFPRSLLARNVLMQDMIPKGYAACYGRDIRSKLCYWDGDIKHSETMEKKFEFASFPCPATADEEDDIIVKLLCATVNPAHTVTATGGCLTITALEYANKTIIAHKLRTANLIAHPSMIPQFGNLSFVEEGVFVDTPETRRKGINFTAKWVTGRSITDADLEGKTDEEIDQLFNKINTYIPVQEAEHHMLSGKLILTEKMERNRVILTAFPDYVGVRGMMHDGRIILAVCNDYAVAQVRVTDGYKG